MKSKSKRILNPRVFPPRIAIAALTLTLSAAAGAELQVGALMEGRGSKALMAGNLERADRVLPDYVSSRLDYSDTNNLCILQILQGNEASAVGTCQQAVKKLKSTLLKRRAKAGLAAEVYNNLAVAQFLAGDRSEAEKSLAVALSNAAFAGEETNNAIANQAAFQQRLALASN